MNKSVPSRIFGFIVYRDPVAVEILTNDLVLFENAAKLLRPLFKTIKEEEVPSLAHRFRIDASGESSVDPGEISRHEIKGEPERIYSLNYKSRVINILRPEAREWRAQHVVRLIRALYRLVIAGSCGQFFHGAMVNYMGAGIALIGRKRSGKTTAMLSLLASGAQYVANDDVGVLQRGEGGWVGVGSTRSVSIRADTARLQHIAAFLDKTSTAGFSHPFNADPSNAQYLHARPNELAELFGTTVCSEANLTHLIFPSFVDGQHAPGFSRLTESEVIQRLHQNLLPIVDKHSECLRPFASQIKIKLAHTAELARLIPGFSCRVSFDCMDRLGRDLSSLVVSERSIL